MTAQQALAYSLPKTGTAPCTLVWPGDGPVAAVSVCRPQAVALGADGVVYFSQTSDAACSSCDVLRRVDPSAAPRVDTLAGFGSSFSEGVLASAARVWEIADIVAARDGGLLLAGQSRVRRIDPSGRIYTVAGTGVHGYGGDGGPALDARLANPWGVADAPDGSVYIADQSNYRVRRVDRSGRIMTVAGTGVPGYAGLGGPPAAVQLNRPSAVVVGPDGSVYIADTNNHRILRIGSSLRWAPGRSLHVASEDGSEVYVFDGDGRHERTLDARTGAVRWEFRYDAAGYLAQVLDAEGDVTQVVRESDSLLRIDSPGGRWTRLELAPDAAEMLDPRRWLVRHRNFAGEAHTFTYHPEAPPSPIDRRGLIDEMRDARGLPWWGMREGRLKRYSAGRHVRVKLADLERFMSQGRATLSEENLDELARRVLAGGRQRAR